MGPLAVILAALILRGRAPTQLGCPTAALAFSEQQIHARVVRLAREDSSWTLPGSGWSVSFFSVAADTYSVRVWASNAVGAGCDTVVTRTAQTTTDVPPDSLEQRPLWDLTGRRVHGHPRSGVYFAHGGRIVVVR